MMTCFRHLLITAFLLPPLSLAAVLLPVAFCQPAAAAEPQEIPAGNLMLVRTDAAERWYIAPHDGRERSVIVITVSSDGGVTMTTQPLPDRMTPTPDDPDDPDDPPPADLQTLVSRWADDVDDAAGRLKLAAAYQATVSLVDGGQIETIEALVALQRAANTLVLGSSASKWTDFFAKLNEHLTANAPADLAGHRQVWLDIVAGLKGDG